MDTNSTYRRRQATAVLEARLSHATDPEARRIFGSTLAAVRRGADLDLAGAARRRAWASYLDELYEPDAIIERLEADLKTALPQGCA